MPQSAVYPKNIQKCRFWTLGGALHIIICDAAQKSILGAILNADFLGPTGRKRPALSLSKNKKRARKIKNPARPALPQIAKLK